MFLSVFDVFKIGIGPSSSHTMGPMAAAANFIDELVAAGVEPHRITCRLHGSLAYTGKGHHTDLAVMAGLSGTRPESIDPDHMAALVAATRRSKSVHPERLGAVRFDPGTDLVFDLGPPLPDHANGLVLTALSADDHVLFEQVYYSIGGGFVVTDDELAELAFRPAVIEAAHEELGHPYPFATATQMLTMGDESGRSIADMKRRNELTRRSATELDDDLDAIWAAMDACIERGLRQSGLLPGGIGVARRAHALHDRLLAQRGTPAEQPHTVTDWLSVWAMAVNEENAAGGRVVTAPTNGAAGVIPAVTRYYRDRCTGSSPEGIRTILLVAAAIGGLIKTNASISGAEVGCQGEVGSAAAMAAAGLCAALGGTNTQVENAAEIALEHHLGLSCDPVGGLVQVPCIERNGLGAVKAVSAASLALHGDGTHLISLDRCIETMRQTGLDMHVKYKETSTGGLAVNHPQC